MINQVIDIVKEASKLMRGDITVEEKDNESNLVTSADINVQHFLEEQLLKLLPGSTFLGEEDEVSEIGDGDMWVVDPIDGTSNFVRGLKESVISVGLVKSGKPYIGVIYNPYKEEAFYAEIGKGAYVNGKPMHVSENDFKRAMFCTAASLYNKDLAMPCFQVLQEVYMQSDDFRRFGSAANELACLAAGRIELFFEMRLFPWDMAAGVVMIEEAGGYVEILHEKELPFARPAGIIAANSKENFDKLREIVYKHVPEKLY